MAKTNLDSQQNAYPLPIETINGIKFTSREIDVLACILSRRTSKVVASILQISPKTVENHIRNIMQKLGCNSRERIIDFIEAAPEAPMMKHRYTLLRCTTTFEQALKEASTQVKRETMLKRCAVINAAGEIAASSLLAGFKKNLESLSIKTEIEVGLTLKNLSILRKNFDTRSEDYLIYLLPQSLKKDIQSSRDFIFMHSKDFKHSSHMPLVIVNKPNNKIFITSFPIITSEKSLSFYYALFDVLECLCPILKGNENFCKLKAKCRGINDIQDLEPQPTTAKAPQKEIQTSVLINLSPSFLLRKWKFHFAAFLFLLMCLSAGFNAFKNGGFSNWEKQNIHSDLILPTKYTLLNRPELIAEIDSKLKGQGDIQTIALTGLAGTGKKVLARQYAKQQNRGIIWEINSERKETLVCSFERLAHALAQTDEDKQDLKVIQDIKIPEERETRIIYFVQERIKDYSNWLLIFYNVDEFCLLEKYVPRDSRWGKGQVIITTTNSNIKNNTYIQGIVQIKELDEQQRLELFSKILKKELSTEWNLGQLKAAKEFLNKIPPFPLDVALAAYYIKETKIPYDLYLQYLNTNNNEFNKLQENVLRAFGEQEKTRYNIIALSLKNLIGLHPEYKNLLFFLSLISSKDIPNDLLYMYKDRSIVDNFLHDLNKYSLTIFTLFDLDKTIPTFSIHRSVQQSIVNYLEKNVGILENNNPIYSICDIFEKYVAEVIRKEDAQRMHIMLDHCLTFLTQAQGIVNSNMKGRIGILIGTFYYYRGNFLKAKQIFEENLTILFASPQSNYSFLGIGLARLGSLHREFGQYKEAKIILEKGLLLYKQYLPEDYIGRAFVLRHLARVYRNLGNFAKAKSLIEESFLLYKKNKSESCIQVVHSQAYLGKILKDLGNYVEAKNLLQQTYTMTVKYYGQEHPRAARILRDLGQVYYLEGDYVKGKELTYQALAIFQKRKLPECYTIFENLAEMHLKLFEEKGKNHLEAGKEEIKNQVINYLNQALKIVQIHFPPNSFHITRIQAKIAKLKENQTKF